MRRLALPAVLLASFVGLGADWARFRGPNGTGVAAGKLPDIDAKAPLWKVAVPGEGISSPIVVGGKVFVQSGAKDGSKRMLTCLDAVTGKTEWTKDVPGHAAKKHAKNSYASGTPASDGKHVYCAWWDGDAMTLAAYDFAGNEKWTASLGSYISDHGAGHSPMVHDGVVYLNADGSKDLGGHATLVAYDAATGQKKWAVERPAHRASFSTPFVWERPGKRTELVVGTTTEITGYDPATGKANWTHPIEWGGAKMKLRVVGSPVASGGLIVCPSGDGGGSRYMLAVDPNGGSPKKVWDSKNSGVPYVPCLLEKNGLLFWVADNGVVACADAKSGTKLWEDRPTTKEVLSSPIMAGSEILAIVTTGEFFVLKAEREYELVRRGSIGEPVSASPALADGRLYVRGATHLFCFGVK
ncbi:outer membrane protein assembly factor BamB family protein [Urbifossiella limnaea]|uniref:Outer membrane biogenesis protein BamB n=1 Tax=Urbifossiella limnaea TaxID=2528023 RepID=A0A517XTT1_9BACT|nr:PQQ-binding-like beta-propeller repeat protein [Urbifossiella limnaea]QDU20864.1 outer membrane biogenesis protein BamB [Urbifossiella limnaea]